MSEIEVGEYIRDKDGFIIKVNEIQEYKEDDDIWYEQETLKGTWKSMVLKHSKNIIDLIEVGDYVNGEPVEKIENNEIGLKEITTTTEYLINKEDIETMLTHEQYEQNCYKVGDIK